MANISTRSRYRLEAIGNNRAELSGRGVYVLFSYGAPVAAHLEGYGAARLYPSPSKTTSQHINQWLERHGLTAWRAVKVGQGDLDDLLDSPAGVRKMERLIEAARAAQPE